MSRSEEFSSGGLDPMHDRVLTFEAKASKVVGRKEVEIRDEFGVTPAHYHQLLSAALADPAAAVHPVHGALVKRLLDRRARVHAARRGLDR